MLRHITEGPTVLLYIHNGMRQFHITEGPTRSYHKGTTWGVHITGVPRISYQRHIKMGTAPYHTRTLPRDKTSEEATHLRKAGQNITRSAPSPEIRTEPQNKRPIPGNPEQNLTKRRVSCSWFLLRQAVQSLPSRAMTLFND